MTDMDTACQRIAQRLDNQRVAELKAEIQAYRSALTAIAGMTVSGEAVHDIAVNALCMTALRRSINKYDAVYRSLASNREE